MTAEAAVKHQNGIVAAKVEQSVEGLLDIADVTGIRTNDVLYQRRVFENRPAVNVLSLPAKSVAEELEGSIASVTCGG